MLYKKGDQIIKAGTPIVAGAYTYYNPSPARYVENGWEPYEMPVEGSGIEEAKADKIADIQEYDNSVAVNSFSFNGTPLWIDKATRVGLVNALQAEIALGNETAEVGLGDKSYTVNCQQAIMMLYSLESYALKCYNRTLAHIAAVRALDTEEAVKAYDFTAGYPEQPEYII